MTPSPIPSHPAPPHSVKGDPPRQIASFRFLPLSLLLAWLTCSLAALAVFAAPVEFTQVAPGVYAALQPFADRFNDSNSAIIVGTDSVIVVDTQTTLTATRAIVGQIRKLTDKPVRFVINTHWHGDHVQGNQVYRDAFPGVQFIAQINTRDDMERRAATELKDSVANLPGQIERYNQMLATGKTPNGTPLTDDQKKIVQMRVDTFSAQLPDLRQTQIVLPDITFDQSTTLYQGAREIRLIHFAGHTRGDAVVYLPAEKILITGDLLDDMPFTGDGSPAALVATLRELDKLDFDAVIPGHGAIERGHDHLRLVEQLFESIVSQVKASVAIGLSLDDTKKKVNVEQFRQPITKGEDHANRAFDGFVPAAIERAYQEAVAATAQSPGLSSEDSAAAFERIKSLAGEWEGKSDRAGNVSLTITVVARGSAVVERYLDHDPPPGDEMVTVYYLDGKRLMLTHYCVTKTQPRMLATRFDPATGQIEFAFLDSTNLASPGAGHMHNIRLRVVDRAHLVSGSDFFRDGKQEFFESTPFTRVK
ncbi:MAG: MBL fold metallo-hydrolase [Candidatus Acidiferrales bacterium]